MPYSRKAVPARGKILSLKALVHRLKPLQAAGRRIVFTNGCFDLMHAGHVKLLEQASRQGDILVVAANSDRSVKSLHKALGRPVNREQDRALVLAALACVDFVVIFDEPTPQRLIERLKPDVLVKGSDWKASSIVGAARVTRRGGRVVRIPLLKGYSTTRLIERIRALPK